MDKEQLTNMSWEDVKNKFDHVMNNNASNDKVTYQGFRKRDKQDKDFVNSLMDVLGYLQNADRIAYYEDIIKHFYAINDIVSTSRVVVDDRNAIFIFDQAIKEYFNQNSDLLDEQDKQNIPSRYKSYRGMSKLRSYNGDLQHPDLIKRTMQHMQQDAFIRYMR